MKRAQQHCPRGMAESMTEGANVRVLSDHDHRILTPQPSPVTPSVTALPFEIEVVRLARIVFQGARAVANFFDFVDAVGRGDSLAHRV